MNEELGRHESSVPPAFPRDAIGLLTDDHRKAQTMLESLALARLGSAIPDDKFQLARQICGDLLIHMAIEEAIFYPKVREVLQDDALVDRAEHEHDAAKELIRQIGEIDPGDPLFDASMETLAQEILDHVEQEETVIFPQMLLAQADLITLGDELYKAKNKMRSDLGLQPE